MNTIKRISEQFLHMLVDMFSDGPLGITVGIITLICCLALFAILGYFLYYLIDSVGISTRESKGVVIGKKFTPAYMLTTMTYNSVTKMVVPVVTYYPDNWTLTIEIREGCDAVSVNESFYESLREGDGVMTTFGKGRLSSGIYIKSVSRK